MLLSADGSDGKESTCNAEDLGSIPGLGRFPREGKGNHSSFLAWRIPWTQAPGRLQFMGSERVGHDWMTNTIQMLLSAEMRNKIGAGHRECQGEGSACLLQESGKVSLRSGSWIEISGVVEKTTVWGSDRPKFRSWLCTFNCVTLG